MNDNEQVVLQVSSLMEKAIKVCNELYEYTYSNFQYFSGNEDNKITEFINKREPIVNTLIDIENKIDLLIDNNTNNDYEHTGEISCKIDGLHQTASSLRSTLSKVMEMDIKAMSLLSEKMQEYKDETLKARNKKNLSAYVRTGIVSRPGLHYDCKK